MKKSMKSFKAISENKKTTVKGGQDTSVVITWFLSFYDYDKPGIPCRYCPGGEIDKGNDAGRNP